LRQGYAQFVVGGDLGTARPGVRVPTTRLRLDFRNGLTADLTLLLFPADWKDGGPGGRYQRQIAAATESADYVSYNGHSDYGHNIATLESWATVVPRHYQIFYINGCSSFAYLDDDLFRKHEQANPGEPRGRYLDVIVNNVEGYFSYGALQNEFLLSALMNQRQRYVDIFAQIDAAIPPDMNPGLIVTGDEPY
jgi:hypothetical protein